MLSGGAPAIGCDLATGTTAPSRALRRWPILDVHDVKQQNANNESLVEAAKLRCCTMCVRNLEARDSSKLAYAHRSRASKCARLQSARTRVRTLRFARTHVRTSRPDPAQDRASGSPPASPTLRRAGARRSACREDGVIRRWSDNDRARANDRRPQRVVCYS